MTRPDSTQAFGLAVEALVARADQLGLTWKLRLATVVDGVNPNNILAIYDGDSVQIRMISFVGPLPLGGRVFAIAIPPSGNYIVGVSGALLISSAGINNPGVADTTTSASYVNLAGTSSFSFTKRQTNTQIEVSMHSTCFTNIIPASVRYGVNINSTDFDVCHLLLNLNLTHHQASGVRLCPGVPAGVHTIQGRWRRTSGAGTLTRDAEDWLSISAKEVVVS